MSTPECSCDSCSVLYMEPEEAADHLQQITEHAKARRETLHQLEILQGFLADEIKHAIDAGLTTEVGAHRLTGISRSTIRDWLGKT